MTSTLEAVRPILQETYGESRMVDALSERLATRIDNHDFDYRGREHNIMLDCWMWFPGGTTAENVAAKIEEALLP